MAYLPKLPPAAPLFRRGPARIGVHLGGLAARLYLRGSPLDEALLGLHRGGQGSPYQVTFGPRYFGEGLQLLHLTPEPGQLDIPLGCRRVRRYVRSSVRRDRRGVRRRVRRSVDKDQGAASLVFVGQPPLPHPTAQGAL